MLDRERFTGSGHRVLQSQRKLETSETNAEPDNPRGGLCAETGEEDKVVGDRRKENLVWCSVVVEPVEDLAAESRVQFLT